MTDSLLSAVSAAERRAFPTMSQLSENDVDSIWSNVSSFVERQMALQKGVHIAGLGTFTFSQQKLDIGNKFVLLQRPVFLLSEKLALSHGLKQNKPLAAAGHVQVVPLNFAALSVAAARERETVEGCVRETLLLLLRAVACGRAVLLSFQGVGALSFRDGRVKMRFHRDFVGAMDGTGRLLWALGNRPGTSSSLLSGRVSRLQRPGSGDTVLLPRIRSGPAGGERAEDGRGSRGAPGPETPEENTEEPPQPPSRPMSRQTLQTAKVNSISCRPEDLDSSGPAQPANRSTVSILEAEDAVGELSRGQPHLNPTCADHTRAGQELCYLCMQRAQRNVPLYLCDERLREQQEEERVLLLNEQQRDQHYLHREQVDRQKMRGDAQKVAAFNLGVSEALMEGRANRCSQFHGSYIFGGRPATPPRLPRQRGYMQELREQADWRRERVGHAQQDQELLDRLHQVQLAQEMSFQKSQQLQQKHQDAKSYQRALDKQVETGPRGKRDRRVTFPSIQGTANQEQRSDQQVEYRGTGIPARQPDSDGPVFGLLDSAPSGLDGQRQRAKRVYQEQLGTANHRRGAELGCRLAEQRKEREMLQMNKKELIADRISRFEKTRTLRASLEDTWSHSAARKHQRDAQERDFLRSGSRLLMDQCSLYRRCCQCHRKTQNRGETNIWRETCFIPGSRLMI